MSTYEVPDPILNSPFDEPGEHWYIAEGEPAVKRPGRRLAMFFYRDPKAKADGSQRGRAGEAVELELVNRIRQRVKEWRDSGYPGVTRTTHELLAWWWRDPLEEIKTAAAQRCVAAVNADGRFGRRAFEIAKKVEEIPALIAKTVHG